MDSSCCSKSAPSLSNYTNAHKDEGGGFQISPPQGPAEINEPRLQSLQSSNTPQTMGPPAEGEYRELKSEETLIKGLGDVVAKDFNCPLSMHNTGRALATQWDALLGYYCQARDWHWKTADAVGRMPAGHLVSSQLRFFFRGGAEYVSQCTESSLLQPYRWPLWLGNLRSMPGQVFWASTKKLKQTDNHQR